jgi:hypothetical protein
MCVLKKSLIAISIDYLHFNPLLREDWCNSKDTENKKSKVFSHKISS